MLSRCCRGWWGCRYDYLRPDNHLNFPFSCPVLHISLMKVVGCIPQSLLGQFVKPLLILPKTLHAVLYRFADCAHHPTRFVIITEIAKLSIFFMIFLVFPMLLIVGTCKIAQTVSDSIQHPSKRCFSLSSCSSYIVQLLPDRSLWVLNSHSCYSGLSLNKILDPFLILYIA